MTKEKKNKKRLLIVLLALLVAVTGAFIGTLSKYSTSKTGSDDAAVAKFGLNIPNTINLFSDSYTNVDADIDGKKIIAPGTSGEYAFEVTGTSEVAYKVSAGITVAYSTEWNGYEPLEFSVDGENWTGSEAFKTNLSERLESKTMNPNEDYASTQTIYWRWPFYKSVENDAKDLAMGLAATSDPAPKVSVTIEVIATQVQ